MDIDTEEIDPMAMLVTEISTSNDDHTLTFPEAQDPLEEDNDVQEIVQETEVIELDDDIDVPAAVNGFHHEAVNPGQIPDEYSEEEAEYRRSVFGVGQQAVQFQRLHCTACNAHLGSSPKNQKKRYIHPLLKVLICKSCFDFYGSGDFDKDEDGSELYCRWCGQGGKVLCCADLQCPYVFCQKCIRANLGKKMLGSVKESDDWLCFVCNPKQIIGLRILSRALYEYVQQEIKLSEETNQPELLKLDKSLCCNKSKSLVPKRKNVQEDKSKKKKMRINPLSATDCDTNTTTSWEADIEDEVVCTPDLTMLMDGEESPGSHVHSALPVGRVNDTMPPPLVPIAPPSTSQTNNDFQYVGQTKIIHYSSANQTSSNLGYKLPGNLPIILSSTTQKPLTKKVKIVKKLLQDNPPAATSLSINLLPGAKHDWFDKATQFTAKVNQNLTTRLGSLSKDQGSVQTLEGLARVHNNLQEILSNSINSLMEIRKNLRSDFILGLKKLKFAKAKPSILYSQLAQDDNDVIVVDSTPAAAPPSPKPAHTYLKVKPASELFGSAVITIPDDSVSLTVSPDLIPDKPPAPDASNPAEELSEMSEMLNPETVLLIKRALLESTFEKILNENLTININNLDLAHEEFKKMASVRVLLESNYGRGTPQSHPFKDYKAMNVYSESTKATIVANPVEEEEDIEAILSTSTLINTNKQICTSELGDDPEMDDPITLEYGLVDREQNMNNGLTNSQENVVVV